MKKIMFLFLIIGIALVTDAKERVYDLNDISAGWRSASKCMIYSNKSTGEPINGRCRLNRYGQSDSTEYMICNFVKGKMENEMRHYFNGNIYLSINYINGVEQGVFKKYYEDGKSVRHEGNYVDGEITGLLKSYYLNGKIETVAVVEKGIKQGVERHYDEETGILRAEFNYKDGIMDSVYRCYDERGDFIGDGVIKDINSKEKLPAYYKPSEDADSLLLYKNTAAQISLLYPANWDTEEGDCGFPELVHQQIWVNASNQLTLTVCRYNSDEAYENDKKLSLSIPRDGTGNPSADYRRSAEIINGYEFIRTDNDQHFGHPSEVGYTMLQSVLTYFDPEQRLIYTFVKLINEDEAKEDLNAIMQSVKFNVKE